MDHPNIIYLIAKIKTLKDFEKLDFLILTTSIISTILKITIFINSLNKYMVLANHLHNLLIAYMKNNKKSIIRIFTLVLELNAKEEYPKDFCNSNIKIKICTDITR